LLVRALASLGDTAALQQLIDDDLVEPRSTEPRHGVLLREAALELRAHGHTHAAPPLFDASLAWWRERPLAERADPAWTREVAIACYHAQQWDEAETLFRAVVAHSTSAAPASAVHHAHLQGHLDEGYLAVIAARSDDTDGELHWRSRLENLDRPFIFGSPHLWLAKCAALHGDVATATGRLRRAFAEGMPIELSLHTDVTFESIRDEPRFRALLQPRG
jgi:hypothetical protein